MLNKPPGVRVPLAAPFMQEYQIRVCKEREELNEKIIKLSAFLASDEVNSLEDADYILLDLQFNTMRTYSNILTKRIARFNQPA